MSHFNVQPHFLKELLSQINTGLLALPNFQRDFVWDPGATEELIESVIRRYPAGNILLLKHDGSGFDIREFEGAPALQSSQVSFLVLDGQQRLTSLYQAFYGKGEHRFFINLKSLMENEDVEEAVFHESATRARRLALDQISKQAAELICPVDVIISGGGFHRWVNQVARARTDTEKIDMLREQMDSIYERWISPIMEYQFPVITLSSDTPLEAVCRMFETLNRRGVKLTVFELLMARSFADRVSLRQLWDQARAQHSILEDFEIDPYYVLQVVSLVRFNTIKRADVLAIDPTAIQQMWQEAIDGLAAAIEHIRRSLGVWSLDLVPYNTMLVPLAAFFMHIEKLKGPAIAAAKLKVDRWFWASVFTQNYEKGPSSRAVSDYKEVTRWFTDEGALPRALRALAFGPKQFAAITPKQRALYRGTLALVAAGGARDFHHGSVLMAEDMVRKNIEDHHIFPRAYLRGRMSDAEINCVLNRTLIDRETNRRISSKAPSLYLNEIEAELGSTQTAGVLLTHGIAIDALAADDVHKFFNERSAWLFKRLKEAVRQEIPETITFVADEEADDSSAEESSRRDHLDPAIVNARPDALLSDLPSWISKIHDELNAGIRAFDANIWTKLSETRLGFFANDRHFMDIRFSSSSIRLLLFVGKSGIPGIETVDQRNGAGRYWGRLRIKKDADLKAAFILIRQSYDRLMAALAAGEKTSWWASAEQRDDIAA